MADLTTDTLPIGRVTLEQVIAQMVADVTAGLDPNDPAYPDVIPGSVLHDLYGMVALQVDRVYDRVHNELPAAAIPSLSFGDFLDAWAAVVLPNSGRKDAAKASGELDLIFAAASPAQTIPAGSEFSTEALSDEDDEITFVLVADVDVPLGGGLVEAVVEAAEAGYAGNVGPNTVTVPDATIAHLTSVANPDRMTSGADVENDEQLQTRILRKMGGGGGPGNVPDYEGWATEEPGVGFATVTRNWDGPGTVRVSITDVDNNPVGAPLIDRLQLKLYPPEPAYSLYSPIGAVVTVVTPALAPIAVEAGVTPEQGFSLDGAGGTRNITADIVAALERYVNRLPSGGDVILAKVIAAIADVPGVANVDVTLPAGDVAIADDEVATLSPAPVLI